jgi:hypothetical protein
MEILNVETFSVDKKVRKRVLRNAIYRIISGLLWGLLSLLKNMNNEMKISRILSYRI